MPWYIYIIKCKGALLYTGITTDLARRIKEHNAGCASRFTRGRAPVKLVHAEKAASRSVALKREAAIKLLSPKKKVELSRLKKRKEKMMLNSSRAVNLFFCIVLFSGVSAYAGQADMLAVIKPEFQKMDTNKDGFVTSKEMQAYQSGKFEKLDKDKNGVIDTKELEADNTKMLRGADKDKDNKITKNESTWQFSQYFKQMDKNKDDKISEAEYTDYWKGIYYF